MDCPRGGSGRGIIHGRVCCFPVSWTVVTSKYWFAKMFTHDGNLVAVTSQEGVVRTNARGLFEEKEAQPKL